MPFDHRRIMPRRDEPIFGEMVALPWGLGEVYCYVHEVYGRPDWRQVVLRLSPELTWVVEQETTVAMPLEKVRRLKPGEEAKVSRTSRS